ncbi:DUF4249 domain-containing protein [Aureibaculum sp. A20]|uniref:DUF4249 domain-containing protein n=1 Tax=Aureibaculum flavum TaxID=2795986 RepID=A0ABS0WSG6_9FLAO|nr:DUF4249 domain-containing protein [Aureibaculum flavum]MBJ2174930.1 DUF4249 domain-containing protein [Aureibaculum flavum]
MKKYRKINTNRITAYIGAFFIALITSGCIEEFNATTESFESILVVDAWITDEFKEHHIKLSRTYRFEQDGATPEQNAEVSITDSNGNIYIFNEVSEGTYVSSVMFNAKPNIDYSLTVETSDNSIYTSKPERLVIGDEIVNVESLKIENNQENSGVEINAFSMINSNDPKYYVYTYEETYKIIAPLWSPVEAKVVSINPPEVELVLKTKQDKICYTTNVVDKAVAGSKTKLNGNTIQKTLIKFIPKYDYEIANRYSILVKQHSISRAADKFYSLLKEFSTSGSLFSQIQTGFIDGNISSQNEAEQKVIGFFNVSSTSSKRIFFNFTDLYPNETSIDLPVDCPTITPELDELVELLASGDMLYYIYNPCLLAPAPEYCDFDEPQGPYQIVPKVCGDCTESGTNIKPEFWEE